MHRQPSEGIKERIKERIRLHAEWVEDNTKGKRLDASGEDWSELDLRGVILDGASFDGANLYWASLDWASLDGASLDWARMIGASMIEANLNGASMIGASLDEANLNGASMIGSNLDGASLDGANLDGASLNRANLTSIRDDFFSVLANAVPEIPMLKRAMREGEIDGSTYEGECACLMGTLEKSGRFGEECDMRDLERPIERWFLAIRPGNTPENHPVAKITHEWIEEFEKTLEKEDEKIRTNG